MPRRTPERCDTIEERRPTLSEQRPTNKNATRRERRAAARAGRQPVAAARSRRPAWQSPMALFSGGAVLVGALIVVVALVSSGQVGGDPSQVKEPTSPIPDKALWDGRALGPADAPVVIEAFEDFQCPACGIFATQTKPQIVKDYLSTGKVRFIFRDYAFIGQESYDAAVAARCAGEQDLFWPYHDYLFANQQGENRGRFSKSMLQAIGTKAGVDAAAFTSCLSTSAPKDAMRAETNEGNDRGVKGTPSVFVNGKSLGFPAYQTLKAEIEAALKAAGS